MEWFPGHNRTNNNGIRISRRLDPIVINEVTNVPYNPVSSRGN